jgi:hypothetical protein
MGMQSADVSGFGFVTSDVIFSSVEIDFFRQEMTSAGAFSSACQDEDVSQFVAARH